VSSRLIPQGQALRVASQALTDHPRLHEAYASGWKNFAAAEVPPVHLCRIKDKQEGITMGKFKKILSCIGIAALILFWFGWSAMSDYTWSQTVIQEKQAKGWVVAATQNYLIDPTHPWTIFKRPIVRIAFVKLNDITRIDKGIVFTKILWVRYADMSRTEEEVFQDVYDCINNKWATVKNEITPVGINLSTLKWREYVGTVDTDIARVICK
jgi:hypothetical protein